MEKTAKTTYEQATRDKVLRHAMRQILWVILLFAPFLIFAVGLALETGPRWCLWPFGLIVLAWLVELNRWVQSATGYEIDAEGIRIVRDSPARDIVIPVGEVISVTRPETRKIDSLYTPHATWFTMRLRGIQVLPTQSEGFITMSPSLWRYNVRAVGLKLYSSVTDAHKLVLIECKDRVYLISPERPDEFVGYVQAMI